MMIVFMAFMGLNVLATSDEPAPIDPILVDPVPEDPILVDPIEPKPVEGEVINPCGENIEVCIFSSGEGTVTEVKVCSKDENGVEVCTLETVVTDGTVPEVVDGEVPPDCEKDPTICQRTDEDIKTLAPTDGEYEDGIYYMTGAKDTADTGMVTVSVVASTLGLIVLGFAANRKFKKN
jgi:hypothetical protein